MLRIEWNRIGKNRKEWNRKGNKTKKRKEKKKMYPNLSMSVHCHRWTCRDGDGDWNVPYAPRPRVPLDRGEGGYGGASTRRDGLIEDVALQFSASSVSAWS